VQNHGECQSRVQDPKTQELQSKIMCANAPFETAFTFGFKSWNCKSLRQGGIWAGSNVGYRLLTR
jgi:hypothetical protein